MIAGLAATLILISIPVGLFDSRIDETGPGTYYLAALLFLAGGFLIGLVFLRSVGMIAFGVTGGALLGIPAALLAGEPEYAPAMLVLAISGILVQRGQAYRLDSLAQSQLR